MGLLPPDLRTDRQIPHTFQLGQPCHNATQSRVKVRRHADHISVLPQDRHSSSSILLTAPRCGLCEVVPQLGEAGLKIRYVQRIPDNARPPSAFALLACALLVVAVDRFLTLP